MNDETPAATRWRAMVGDRLDEFQRLSPGAGSLSDGSFWDRRADRHGVSASPTDIEADPFLRRLRRVARPSGTAIDVGAGGGRFALPLAAGIGHVIAVDPSAVMLKVLRRGAAERGLNNLTTVRGTWEEAGAGEADIVFSAFVLTLVPDARPFLRKLEAAARDHVLLYLGAYSGDAVLDPLWRHFHGAPRSPGPTYLDAIAVLRELGIAPEVKVVETPNPKRFATVDEAVEHYREGLLLTDGPDVTRELRGLLTTWLMGRRGALRSPLRTIPAAIIQWSPRPGD